MKQGEFISNAVGLARQLPQKPTAFIERGPAFFRKGGRSAYRDVENRYRKMYESSVKRLVPPRLSGEFKEIVQQMKDAPDHAPVLEKAMTLLGPDFNRDHAAILRGAANAYTYALKNVHFLKSLGDLSPSELREFASSRDNRHEASMHLERFARLYTLANQHQNFESELEHHIRELVRINDQVQMPGIDHHYLPTEMHLFHGLHPSIFGGDHFHLMRFQDLPKGEELYGFHLVDVAGHSEPYWSPINSTRTMLAGISEAVGEFASGKQVLRRPKQYLQRLAALVNNTLEKRESGGSGIFGLIDAKRGKLYYLSAGHPLPAVFLDNKLLKVKNAGGTFFGSFPKAPKDYSVGCLDLRPGMVVKMWTDGIPERKVKGKQADLSDPLDEHFASLADAGHDAKTIAHGVVQEAERLFEGRVFPDDGSVFVFRYHGLPRPPKSRQKSRVK